MAGVSYEELREWLASGDDIEHLERELKRAGIPFRRGSVEHPCRACGEELPLELDKELPTAAICQHCHTITKL